MAVYTHLAADELAGLIEHYDVGELVSAKGIAEGVSNSNWLVETTGPHAGAADGGTARFVLTMYERRIETRDLPFFLGLLDHLAAGGCPVPRTIHDRAGNRWRECRGKAVALIEFLPGISVERPSPVQARAVGTALARMHLRAADFPIRRKNELGVRDWSAIFARCGTDALAAIDNRLPELVDRIMPRLLTDWPADLPVTTIHADLFPDNVLLLGDAVSGLIDFYFACKDMATYDLAVTHSAWCFPDGVFAPAIARALLAGYEDVRPLSSAERSALPLLAQGAAMRFVATRTVDWIDTPPGALVQRKDPMEFVSRATFYGDNGGWAFET